MLPHLRSIWIAGAPLQREVVTGLIVAAVTVVTQGVPLLRQSLQIHLLKKGIFFKAIVSWDGFGFWWHVVLV